MRTTIGEAPVTAAHAITEEDYKLVVNLSLAENAAFPDLRAPVDADGDFIVTDVYGTSTGAYSIAFRNAGGRALSSAEISNANAIGTAQFPVPFGGVQYPAGGQIAYSITNAYAGTNAIQLVLRGIKLRKVGR